MYSRGGVTIRKYLIFMLMLMLMIVSRVNAEECDAYDIKRLKEIANGVEVTYELQEPYATEDDFIEDMYKVSVSGLTEEIFINNESSYVQFNEYGEAYFRGGKYTLIIRNYTCDYTLRKINLALPIKNFRYNFEKCKLEKNKDLDVCQEFVLDEVSDEQFNSIINSKEEQKEEKKEFKINFKYIVFSVIAVSLIFVILLVISKRKKGGLD